MFKPFLIVSVFTLLGVAALSQEAPPAPATPPAAAPSQFNVPAEYASKVNPVKPTAESQARAKKQYGGDCAMCHGDNGDGRGDVAAEQKLPMRDYRDPAALKNLDDARRRARRQRWPSRLQPPGIHRVKPVHILVRRNSVEQRLGVYLFGQW